MQHYGLLQHLRKKPAAVIGQFQYLDLIISLQAAGQCRTNVSAASNHDPAVGFVDGAQLRGYCLDILPGGDKKHLVVGLYHSQPFGNDGWRVLSENRSHPGIDVGHVVAYFLQLSANDGPTLDGAHGHQLYSPFGKVQYLQRSGVGNELLDVVGYQLLRADDDVDGDGTVFKQLPAALEVIRGAYSGYFGGCSVQGKSHLTGEHIDLVRVGHRYQQIGIFSTRVQKRGRVCRISQHRTDIKPLLQRPQGGGLAVDNRNFVLLVSQLFRQGAPDLACAQDDNFHGLSNLSSGGDTTLNGQRRFFMVFFTALGVNWCQQFLTSREK